MFDQGLTNHAHGSVHRVDLLMILGHDLVVVVCVTPTVKALILSSLPTLFGEMPSMFAPVVRGLGEGLPLINMIVDGIRAHRLVRGFETDREAECASRFGRFGNEISTKGTVGATRMRIIFRIGGHRLVLDRLEMGLAWSGPPLVEIVLRKPTFLFGSFCNFKADLSGNGRAVTCLAQEHGIRFLPVFS